MEQWPQKIQQASKRVTCLPMGVRPSTSAIHLSGFCALDDHCKQDSGMHEGICEPVSYRLVAEAEIARTCLI